MSVHPVVIDVVWLVIELVAVRTLVIAIKRPNGAAPPNVVVDVITVIDDSVGFGTFVHAVIHTKL